MSEERGRNRFVSLTLVIVFLGPMLFVSEPVSAWPFDIQIISNDDGEDSRAPAIAVSCDNENCRYVHVVWVELYAFGGHTACKAIFYKRSSDRGETWDIGPVVISRPHQPVDWGTCLDAGRPSIAVVGQTIYVVWPNGFEFVGTPGSPLQFYHIYLQYNPNNGEGPWQPDDIQIDDGSYVLASIPWEVHASVDATNDNIHAVWKTGYLGWPSPEHKIRYDKAPASNPLGWGVDKTLTDTDRPWANVPDVAAYAQYVHVIYWDRSDTGLPYVYYLKSTIYGDSWPDDPVPITPTSAKPIDHPPTISVTRNYLHVAWEDVRDPSSRHVYYIRSSSNGDSWDTVDGERISDVGGVNYDNLIPSIDSSGATVYVVWLRQSSSEQSIFYDWNSHNGDVGRWGDDILIYPWMIPAPPEPIIYPWFADISVFGNGMHVVWHVMGTDFIYEVYYTHQLDEISQAGTLPERLKGTASVYAFYPHPAPGSYKVFVIGGETSSGGLSGDVWMYNPISGSFDPDPYCTLGGASPGVAYASAIWDGGNHIYLFGGKTPTGPTDNIWAIDLSDPQSPYRCMVTGSKLTAPMYATSAVYDGTHAWIFGGYDDPDIYYSDIQQWDLVWLNDAEPVHYFLPPRAFTSAVIDSGMAYIFGGRYEESGSPIYLNEIVEFNTDTKGMTTMSATLPTPRSRTSAAFDDTYAYVFGGEDDSGQPLDEIVRFNVKGNWGVAAVQICEKLPMKLSDTSATVTINSHAIGGGIRIFGGQTDAGQLTDQIERFDLAYWIH